MYTLGLKGIPFQLILAGVVLWFLSMPLSAEAAKVQYVFKSWNGPALRVHATRPVHLAPDRPIVFVMHDVERDAAKYRDQWHELANEHDFLLLVPEFSKRDFPGAKRYNLGHVFNDQGAIRAESAWTYSVIEAIFDDARSRFGMSSPTYSIYGHSAGAQFVHRFIFHVPEARVNRIVAANAGWYMMPDSGVEFPYGLKDSAVDRNHLKKSLQLPVTILLGDQDTDPEDPDLRRTPEALAQGEHRMARGLVFYDTARAAAQQLDVPFNWSLEMVEEADHDNRLMAPAAIPFLLNQWIPTQ